VKNMRKGIIILLVGVILVVAAMGIYIAFSAGATKEMKELHLSAGETKELSFQLKSGDYYLVISSDGKVNYTLLDEKGEIVKSGTVEKQFSGKMGHLSGNYTLRVENLEDKEVNVNAIMKSEESLLSLGTAVLASVGVFVAGIIVIIAGVILTLKERKKEDEEHVY